MTAPSSTPRAAGPDRAGRRTSGAPAARLTGGPRRRRRVPYLLLGVVLVVGCAVAGLVAGARVGSREPVLVLARPVTVGHVLAAGDVREVRISVDGVDTIGAGERDSVLGKPVAYSLPAGTVLSRAAVDAAQVPPPGEAIAAVALKAGQFPTGLAAGSRVTVVVAPATSAVSTASAGGAESWPATVVAVVAADTEQTTVVSLQLAEADARALAAAPAGQIGVVTVNGSNG
ncbi:SAF domain-containing protein [Frankia sp. Cpl3]|uniref:SAF domain-containing protein n=1 Tax=Parafrankia colletiae TaxID=573497 RepID=UPI001F523686|nr:SAF domain-containing protein [Parafrankia colletiae]MCK9904450.1 SAF domain-containing protein [Frankia sp. Cpl3]